ncbi:ABC transporter ATP-binding protein [Streptomyces triticagri]|uniref:ABC transporter ATP-binding protein n=1 Tax=Streptomyces triticagri TaxID=2293568 RepID=A0A372M7T2_9ACTN|nr:ABC transporter ATP-binding protein [Streptomyces triticagri]RFU87004.1 ABC transporter ATP-binding protein [Streptomyces triticagri]
MTTAPYARPQHSGPLHPGPLQDLPGYDPGAAPLEVGGLQVEFPATRSRPRADVVSGATFRVASGRTLAVVGESGSGKSLTARAVMGLLPHGARVTDGHARLCGVDLLGLPDRQARSLRGRHIAMVFQDALAALNPVVPVGHQIAEVYRVHGCTGRREAFDRAVAMLARVGIPEPAVRAGHYPHQFSGGMRQRVMIAMALALTPRVLIADEPTTALDVTVQAQILGLLKSLKDQHGLSLVLISHDLSVVAGTADRVAVMYGGRVVEEAAADDLYARPAHPYTRALLDAVPRRGHRGRPLAALPGAPPDPARPPGGCPFRPRCSLAQADCAVPPPLETVGPGHLSACHRSQEVSAR